ncbi:hypothetical protein ABZP36_016855 [Zizania latifolia]
MATASGEGAGGEPGHGGVGGGGHGAAGGDRLLTHLARTPALMSPWMSCAHSWRRTRRRSTRSSSRLRTPTRSVPPLPCADWALIGGGLDPISSILLSRFELVRHHPLPTPPPWMAATG